jgi:hypothetical protein
MSSVPVKPWVEVAILHPDVVGEHFSEDMFALDMGPLADGNLHVPAVYRDPEQFFRSSYLTQGLRGLLQDVLSRLTGGGGNRVIKLITPFGGGKSHTLASLYHSARRRQALNVIPEGKALPDPGPVRTAVFDGQFFGASKGKQVPGESFYARTLWGWIAWSLGGRKGYELLREQDEARIAPGGDEILALLAEGPNLILLDEVLPYLISAGGVKIEQTTLRDETLIFLQRLTVAVGNTDNTALVFSLQSSKRESLEYANLLQMVDHLAARVDQRREPVEGNEVLSVIQRRLLAKLPTAAEASPAANAFQETVTQMRRAYAPSTAERQQAEEEGIELRDRMRASYPFHPALIDLMRERWAAIPEFQRTRGALRFLAACLRSAHRQGKSRAVLGPGDVPIYDSEVRLAFFKEVGQQSDFQAVLEHDLTGANARSKRIDDRRAKENPAEAIRRPAFRLATAILMYSFGGLRREGGNEAAALPAGVTEADLLAACVGPDLDSTTALACLKEMSPTSSNGCLYLHFDGVRYCFKKDPNVTLLIEQEAAQIARDDKQVRNRVKEMIEARLAGHRNAIVWPDSSADIPDRDPSFLIAYLPLEFAAKTRHDQEAFAKECLEKYSEKPRSYRNGVGLAVPTGDQVEILRRSVRYLIAAENLKAKAKLLNLTDEQRGQLRERESTEAAAAESAFLKLYTEVWFPRSKDGTIGIEKIAAGGRPLQTTLGANRLSMIHERIVELITTVQPRVFTSLKPGKVVELFRMGEGTPATLGVRTSEVLDGFYSFLGFTRVMTSGVIRKALACGIQDGHFGYASGPVPALSAEGKFEIASAKVRFMVNVSEDEIDLESGFLILPQGIPQPTVNTGSTPAAPSPGAEGPTPHAGGPSSGTAPSPGIGPTGGSGSATGPALDTLVELSFSADRNELFEAWNAVANLADMAGKVSVSIRAASEKGFDKAKLRNGVLEPLREADLID